MEIPIKTIDKSQIAKACSEVRSKKRKSCCVMVFLTFCTLVTSDTFTPKDEADVLIVSLTPDKFVNKGPGRPIFSEHLRAEMVASLSCVDLVVVNDEADAITIIKEIKPNIYFKGDEYKFEGSDFTGMIERERQAVEEIGGEIRYSSELTFSSSSIAKKTFSRFLRMCKII